jgi:hypothetical protein
MADGRDEGGRTRRTAAGAGLQQLSAQRFVSCQSSAVVRPLGYQGSKAAMKLIAKADVVLALGTRLGPFGTLPQYGIEYWPKQAKIIQVDADAKMLGLVKTISVGICGDAKAAASCARCAPSGKVTRLPRPIATARLADLKAEKSAWETELDGWRFEKDPWSLEVAKSSTYMHPRQMLRELEKGDAGRRDGLHRHRQHLLGVEFVSALQPAAVDVRGDELRQLRLCVSDHRRRQGRSTRASGHCLRRRRCVGA